LRFQLSPTRPCTYTCLLCPFSSALRLRTSATSCTHSFKGLCVFFSNSHNRLNLSTSSCVLTYCVKSYPRNDTYFLPSSFVIVLIISETIVPPEGIEPPRYGFTDQSPALGRRQYLDISVCSDTENT